MTYETSRPYIVTGFVYTGDGSTTNVKLSPLFTDGSLSVIGLSCNGCVVGLIRQHSI